jgi:hypothetical protein
VDCYPCLRALSGAIREHLIGLPEVAALLGTSLAEEEISDDLFI